MPGRADPTAWVETLRAAAPDISTKDALRQAIFDNLGKSNVRVNKIVFKGESSFMAHGHCQEHPACSVKFRFLTEDGDLVVYSQGDHSLPPDSNKRHGHAVRVSHLNPLQARRHNLGHTILGQTYGHTGTPEPCFKVFALFSPSVSSAVLLPCVIFHVITHMNVAQKSVDKSFASMSPEHWEAKAQLISERLPEQEMPTMKQIEQAHRKRQKASRPAAASAEETLQGWVGWVAARTENPEAHNFEYHPLRTDSEWLGLGAFAEVVDLKAAPGSCLFLSPGLKDCGGEPESALRLPVVNVEFLRSSPNSQCGSLS